MNQQTQPPKPIPVGLRRFFTNARIIIFTTFFVFLALLIASCFWKTWISVVSIIALGLISFLLMSLTLDLRDADFLESDYANTVGLENDEFPRLKNSRGDYKYGIFEIEKRVRRRKHLMVLLGILFSTILFALGFLLSHPAIGLFLSIYNLVWTIYTGFAVDVDVNPCEFAKSWYLGTTAENRKKWKAHDVRWQNADMCEKCGGIRLFFHVQYSTTETQKGKTEYTLTKDPFSRSGDYIIKEHTPTRNVSVQHVAHAAYCLKCKNFEKETK